MVACVIALVVACLPLPIFHSFPQRARVGGATLFSVLTVGAAWLLWVTLPAFQSALRHAFIIICAGVTLLGVSLLEQPVIQLFNVQSDPLINLIYPLPILAASVLFHAGNLRYVRLVGVRNFWTTMAPALMGSVALAAISWVLPHPPALGTELIHDLTTAVWSGVLMMPVASAIALPMAARRLPDLYKPPIRALQHAMYPVIAVTSYLYVLNLISYREVDDLVTAVLFLLVIVMGLQLLRAGYMFNRVSRY